jgi:hypothetical protein
LVQDVTVYVPAEADGMKIAAIAVTTSAVSSLI